MSIRLPLLVLLLAIVPGLHAAEPAPPFDLTPDFESGQQSRYEVWTLRQQVHRLEGAPAGVPTEIGSTFEIEGEISWTVDRVGPDGSSSATMTIDWLAATVEQGDQPRQRVDSRQASGPIEKMHRLLVAMTGVPITVELAADGTVESVAGVNRIQQTVGDDVTAPDELDFIESATDLVTLPGAPAAADIGDTWARQFTWNREGGELDQAARFTLASVESIAGIPVATVAIEADLAFRPEPPPANGPPINVRMVSGDFTGQVMFDLERTEAVGRNSVEKRVLEAVVQLPDGRTITRTSTERVQSQVLRIGEGE